MALTKLAVTLLALAGSSLAADLPSIRMKGKKFFFENGTEFFMKGIAYQQDTSAAGATSSKTTKYVDPLADEAACKRDIPLLQELNVNTIRVYAIDPTADHSKCMDMLQKAGIYVVADLSVPDQSINRDNPQWNVPLLKRYTDAMDELLPNSNVIGFLAGNEVSNNKSNTDASAYVKAAVRDSKAYIASKKLSRWVGVGYAANDDVDIRAPLADYFACGTDAESIDYMGYNVYSWCGRSDMQKSGYSKLAEFYGNYSKGAFFAEYGCNLPNGAAGRIWQETAALYNDEMAAVFSGGIVYMYFQEENDYGVVKVSGGKAVKQDDFDGLAKAHAEASPKGVQMSEYADNAQNPQCPPVSSSWRAHSALPPVPDESLCSCMTKSRRCGKASSLQPEGYGEIFGFICGAKPSICAGIRGNATAGIYGAYSMCSDADKLEYVLDAYYQDQDSAMSACDFGGNATTKTPAQTESTCSDKLRAASSINQQVATATAPVGGAAAATSDSFAAPLARAGSLLSMGDYAIGAYMVVAVLVGAGMVAL